jgi:hypothetical protein
MISTLTIVYYFTIFFKSRYEAILISGKIFRYSKFDFPRKFVTNEFAKLVSLKGKKRIGEKILEIIETNISKNLLESLRFYNGSEGNRPFDQRLLILSAPENGQKGVIIIKFTNFFKYFLKVFDINKIKDHYILILEPSSSGYFDEDILCMLSVDIPIIVQTPEPVDANFLRNISTNLHPIDIGANCWVDNRVFFPITGTKKDFDIIMVAIWADVKRHYHLFDALSKCKKRHRIVLIGKPWPKRIDDIIEEAALYNVDDQITYFEDIPQEEINLLLNRSKIFLLLSKKEGFNKAIIEAMYAGTPGYYLKNFNFGHEYAYIQSGTGGFIESKELNNFIDNLDEVCCFNPLDTSRIIQNMVSPEISTKSIIKELSRLEKMYNININKKLSIKINTPELNYKDIKEWERYNTTYNDLFDNFLQ